MVRFASAAAALCVAASVSLAAPLKIGDKAPMFTGLEAVDGKSYSLADMKDKDVVVVCTTCNHCPMAIKYEDRLVSFYKKHCGDSSKVGMIALCVNTGDEDSLPKMKDRAKDKGFMFPYAADPTQKVGKDLDAKTTPEFFVFNKERKLVYKGAMDDNNDASKVKVNYVEEAVKAALKGEMPKTTEVKARGCGISYGSR